MKVLTRGTKSCPFCPKTFSAEGLKIHLVDEHLELNKAQTGNEAKEIKFRCEKCDKDFKLEKNYKRHVISLHDAKDIEGFGTKENANEDEIIDEINQIQAKKSEKVVNKRRLTLQNPIKKVDKSRLSLPSSVIKTNTPNAKKNGQLAKLLNNSNITLVNSPVQGRSGTPGKGFGAKSIALPRTPMPAKPNNLMNTGSVKSPGLSKTPTTSKSLTISRTPLSKSVTVSKTPISKSVTISNTPISNKSLTVSRTPIMSKTPISKSVTISKNPMPRTPMPSKTGSILNSGNFTFQCQKCNKSFGDINKLQSHIAIMHKNGRHPCKKCGKVFNTLDNHQNHVNACFKGKTGVTYNCQACKVNFSDVNSLRAHVARSHQKSGQAPKSGQLPKIGQMSKIGLVPKSGQMSKFRQLPKIGQISKSGDVPKSGQISKPAQIPKPGQVPNSGQILKNGQVSKSGLSKSGHVPKSEQTSKPAKESEAKNFNCIRCPEGFEVYQQLLTHLMTYHKPNSHIGTYICSKCAKKFNKELSLLIHLSLVHPEMRSKFEALAKKIPEKKPIVPSLLPKKDSEILTMEDFKSDVFQPKVYLERLPKSSLKKHQLDVIEIQ